MTVLPEHEERHVREYVNSQSPEDDEVSLVQKVGSRRIMGRMYELYDVQTEKSRWWVISDPMNLYSQGDFPEVDLALTFHLGLRLRVFEQSRTEIAEERQRRSIDLSRSRGSGGSGSTTSGTLTRAFSWPPESIQRS